jgi:hypothetical protein
MSQTMDFIGWTGVAVYVLAYGFLSAGLLKPDRSLYHVLNAVGALSLVVYSNAVHDMPNVIVNVIWLGIAAVSIIRIIVIRRRRGAP